MTDIIVGSGTTSSHKLNFQFIIFLAVPMHTQFLAKMEIGLENTANEKRGVMRNYYVHTTGKKNRMYVLINKYNRDQKANSHK